ncbi:MAG: DMT family transporter [Rhodomicrobiaceae bacterium]
MSIAPIEDRRLAGIALMVAACLFFTGIDSCAKWLVLDGMPPLVVVFARYAVHMLLAFALFLPSRRLMLFSTGRPWLEAARGFSLLGSTVCNFIAVQFLPLTLTAAIFFTVPLWICLLSIPFLGEHVGMRRWTAIVTGLGGALIATRPWSADFHWVVFLSIGSAIFTACYAILTRQLAGVDSTATQQIYAAVLATLGVAPMALIDWHWPVAGIDWFAFGVIGFFGWSGHQLLTVAHRYAPATTLAPFLYVQMLFMIASSWLIFSTPPDVWVLVGAAIVLVSGFYVWLRERKLAGTGRTQLSGGELVG